MRKLIFATNNNHKVVEMRQALKGQFEILPLKEAGIFVDIPEPHDTIEENSSEKSGTILKLTGQDCFSEDTGLEVEALGGAPGVRSARYVEAGEPFPDNVTKLLSRLENITNRLARFKTVISLRLNGKEFLFEGICNGRIVESPTGTHGFGYDSIFVPEGSDKTFAEMELEEKNLYSHRAKAVARLARFLSDIAG